MLTVPQQGFAQKMSSLASDPVAGAGFARALWVNSIQRMVVFVGGISNASPVRAYDPLTNTWTFLYTQDNSSPSGSPGHPGIPGRDNYASWYVPQRDEMWLWGGSYVNTLPPDQQYYSGRFSFAGCHPVVFTDCGKWAYRSLNYADMGPGIVKNNVIGYGADPACAWSRSANRGMCGWAFNGDNAQIPFVVEPNDSKSVCPGAGTGSEPYISCYVKNGTLPPPRVQNMNSLVAVGNDFYLYGGDNAQVDLWKFSGVTHTWTRLPDSPARIRTTAVTTYDSDLNAVVVWAGDKIYVFDLATQQWTDRTPAKLPCINNHLGVYAPNVKMHIYEGGTYCAGPRTEHATGITIGISFSGTGTPISAPAPTSTASIGIKAQTSSAGNRISPPSPTPTPSTASGRTPVGYLDGIDANGIAWGWTYDPDVPSQNNTVQIYADGPAGSGTLIGTLTANSPRSDVNSAFSISGDHGFTFSIPANLKDGKQHQLYAYGIDLTGDANFLLNGSPKSFTLGSISPNSPTPTTKSTRPSTSTRNATCYGGLCLPIKTWVAKPLPRQNSPCSAGAGCKQYSAAVNLQNGRIYFFGGDTNEGGQGGWGATYSHSILSGDWKVEYPACGPIDQIQPRYPSEGAWAYDSNRNLFYWPSGFYYQEPNKRCPNDSNHLGLAQTFNPVNQRWSQSPFPALVNGGIGANSQTAVFDPVTDALYQISEWTGGMGMSILNLKTNTWKIVGIPCAENSVGPQGPCGPGQTYVNSGFSRVNNLYTDIDVKGRAVYFIKGGDGTPNNPARLLRYNIDRKTVTVMPALPVQSGNSVAWDSINKVLYYWTDWENADSVLYIYHPDPTGGANGTWERDAMYQPEGIQPRGFTIVFDPIHNAFMLIGGVNWNSEVNPSFLTYYFLYRYGNGDGKPYTPPQSQPSPQLTPSHQHRDRLLHLAKYLGVTGEDKVGPVNQTTPNGKPDFHVFVSGLRGKPNKVTIANENNGTWETPFNGTNWIIATQYDDNRRRSRREPK
jgi:Kelch motif